MSSIEQRYIQALKDIPPPGSGCHPKLLGVASLGIMAEHSDFTILNEIRAHIPAGTREVTDDEIQEAIDRAHQDTAPFTVSSEPIFIPPKTPPDRFSTIANALKNPEYGKAFQAHMIDLGGGELDPEGSDVYEKSPVRFKEFRERLLFAADILTLLENLYRPDDVLFIGNYYNVKQSSVKTVSEWLELFQEIFKERANLQLLLKGITEKYPHIIPNPLTGEPGTVKGSDKQTLRGDNCVKSYRYIVAEFDDLPMPKQGAVLRGLCSIDWKIAALIHSGGKSCHAWLTVDREITNADEWAFHVKGRLFPMLAALGVDRACSNPSRLSRLPGAYRTDKSNWQRLLYLAPKGGII